MPKPTAKDVAREAGVSVSTVSRALSGRARISEATKRRVLETADRLGWSPNLVARSLVNRGTRTLALFMPDITNPFFAAIARGVADAVDANGYALVLCNTDGSLDGHSRYAGLLRGSFVDGVVLCGTAGPTEELAGLIPAGLPTVVVDGVVPGLKADSVRVDNRFGGVLATQHLISLGCSRILHLGGPRGALTAEERWMGYREALGDRYDPGLVSRGPFRAESGYVRTRAALREGLVFDGIFAANDLLALGALQALGEAGRAVPEEVKVVGFDDIYMASLSRPQLTTVAQPTYRMGTIAGRMLLERLSSSRADLAGRGEGLAGRDPDAAGPVQGVVAPVQDVVLEPVLRVRGSTAARPGR